MLIYIYMHIYIYKYIYMWQNIVVFCSFATISLCFTDHFSSGKTPFHQEKQSHLKVLHLT